jgi:hypothetical protein
LKEKPTSSAHVRYVREREVKDDSKIWPENLIE